MTRSGRALVTGASGGLGLLFAEHCARDGFETVLVARSGDKLDEVATDLRQRFGTAVHTIATDLSADGAADTLRDRLRDDGHWPIDVLVNNAGFGSLGPFATSSADDVETMIRLNVSFVVRFTHFVLDGMRETGRGRILNVASTAAFQPGPYMAVYYATKAFVLSWSEALDEELRDAGISVTTLCPGPVRTGFQDRAGIDESTLFRSPLVLEARDVADQGWYALRDRKRLRIAGWLNWLGVQVTRLLPRRLTTWIVRRVQESR